MKRWAFLILMVFISTDLFAASAEFSWFPNDPAEKVKRYYIHYGVESGVYTEKINVGHPQQRDARLTAIIYGLEYGKEYFFAATAAHDEAESDFSVEVVHTPVRPGKITGFRVE